VNKISLFAPKLKTLKKTKIRHSFIEQEKNPKNMNSFLYLIKA
jgi:hypothetical protein